MDPIFFNSRTPQWAWLSNFSPSRMTIRDHDSDEQLVALTVEHAYQAAKTRCGHDRRWILASPTPGIAKRRGAQVSLRSDWDPVKFSVMAYALAAKFAVGSSAARLLTDTGDRPLVHRASWDRVWGDGPDGQGLNVLGQMLQVRRDALNQAYGLIDMGGYDEADLALDPLRLLVAEPAPWLG